MHCVDFYMDCLPHFADVFFKSVIVVSFVPFDWLLQLVALVQRCCDPLL